MEIRRRDFLKVGVAAGASIALNGLPLNAFANGKDQKMGMGGTEPGRWIHSSCQGCTTWCAVEVFAQNGRAVKVRGNQFSKANGGYVLSDLQGSGSPGEVGKRQGTGLRGNPKPFF